MKITVKKCREMTLEEFLEFTGSDLYVEKKPDGFYLAVLPGVGSHYRDSPVSTVVYTSGKSPKEAVETLVNFLNHQAGTLSVPLKGWFQGRQMLEPIRVTLGEVEVEP